MSDPIKGYEPPKTKAFQIDSTVQDVLFQMNSVLQPLEEELIKGLPDSQNVPLLFISFVPRSGSTLLSQILANSGAFNYVSNFQARFWLAPYIGGMVEKSLFSRNEKRVELESRYGLTDSLSAPSEFGYFWRYWLSIEEDKPQILSEDKITGEKAAGFAKEMNAIRALSSMPVFFKKEWPGMNAGLLIKNLPNVKFIHLTRDPLLVAQSIYKARTDVFGSPDVWWAAKPSGYEKLKDMDPFRQIAGQIRGIRDDIGVWEKQYPEHFLRLKYEETVTDLPGCVDRILAFLGLSGVSWDKTRIPLKLPARNQAKLETKQIKKFEKALSEFGLL